jgi:hypothetical protein
MHGGNNDAFGRDVNSAVLVLVNKYVKTVLIRDSSGGN